ITDDDAATGYCACCERLALFRVWSAGAEPRQPEDTPSIESAHAHTSGHLRKSAAAETVQQNMYPNQHLKPEISSIENDDARRVYMIPGDEEPKEIICSTRLAPKPRPDTSFQKICKHQLGLNLRYCSNFYGKAAATGDSGPAWAVWDPRVSLQYGTTPPSSTSLCNR
ncbi:hypothetical protein GBAR_LOCUS17118, partial [Geodia barretti]